VKNVGIGVSVIPDGPEFTNVNGKVFFRGGTSGGKELWSSDGTDAGTALVKDITPGSQGSFPRDFENVNGTLFFSFNGRNELWKSDGTESGTVLIAESYAGSPSTNATPSDLVNVNGKLFF